MELLKKGLVDKMNELKPCLIDRNKIPLKELWQEARFFADDIVCAVGTDFMQKIAEAEHKVICDLLNHLQQMEVVDAEPMVRCRECKQGEIDDPDFPDQYYCHAGCGWNNGGFYCAYGEPKEGAK